MKTDQPTDWLNQCRNESNREREREREKKGINQYQETYKMSLKHFHHYVDGYVWLAEWNLWWIRRMLGIFGIMVSWLVNAFLIFFVVVSDLTHSVSVSVSLSLSLIARNRWQTIKSRFVVLTTFVSRCKPWLHPFSFRSASHLMTFNQENLPSLVVAAIDYFELNDITESHRAFMNFVSLALSARLRFTFILFNKCLWLYY